MKTIIVQSYRSTNIPEWIEQCMQSVRDWCKARGYEYHFVGDELFDFAPSEFRNGDFAKIVLTDYCRLALCRMMLGPDTRVGWMDADVLIFNPTAFDIEIPYTNSMVMCQECWQVGKLLTVPIFDNRVNNAVMIFKDTEPLDMLLGLSRYVLRNSYPNDWMLGPTLLTPLMQKIVTRPQLQRNVGCMGPNVFTHIHRNPVKYGKQLANAYQCPVYAANLCHSFTTASQAYNISPEEMLVVVHALKNNANLFALQATKPVPRTQSLSLKVFFKIQKVYRTAKSFRNWSIKQLIPFAQCVLSY